MTGPREVNLRHIRVHGPRVHALDPVLVVAVDDPHRDRAAERTAMTNPGRDLRAVLLDLHAPATAMAELAPSHVAVQVLGRELESGRKTLDDSRQPRTMRFAGGREADASHALNLQARVSQAGGRARTVSYPSRRTSARKTTAGWARRAVFPRPAPCHSS